MTRTRHVEIAKTVSELENIRQAWTAMQNSPDADLEFYLTLVRTRPEILRPHVITLKDNDEITSILIGRLETKHLTVPIGYRKLSLPPVRCLTIMGRGVLGDVSGDSVSSLMDSIETSLRTKEADIAWFHLLDTSSIFYRRVTATGGLIRRDYFPLYSDNWRAKLPGTYDQLIRRLSSNTRHNLKRYSKRLQQLLGDKIVIKRFQVPADIKVLMTDTETIACKTYHRGLNTGFMDNEETRHRMLLYATAGRLRAHILYDDVKPIAFWNGFLYGKTFYTWTTGFDPEYRDCRPGSFLLQTVFEDLCREQTIKEVDFGSGDAQYKKDWCDENRREASLCLFAPSARGLSTNVLRSPLLACSQAARWALIKANLVQRAKSMWRSHLVNGLASKLVDKQRPERQR